MTRCHDESKRPATTRGVTVSAHNNSAMSTYYGHGEMTFKSEAPRLNAATTLGTDAGGNSCSLVIHYVKCVGTGWRQ